MIQGGVGRVREGGEGGGCGVGKVVDLDVGG